MNIKKQNSQSLFAAVAANATMIFLFSGIVATHAAQASLINCDDLRHQQLLRDPSLIIVDARSPSDFFKEHIQGARNIQPPLAAAGLPREANIVVYCSESACPLSGNAADALASSGYPHVSRLDGGLSAWAAKGYPIQSSTKITEPIVPQIAAQEARKLLAAGTVVFDVRPPSEFAAGHLPGARSIPLELIERGQGLLPRGTKVLVYDRLSERMSRASRRLAAAGANVSELSGGLAGWIKQRLPVTVK